MPSAISLQKVRVQTNSDDQEGRLVFFGDRLIAVLVRLTDQAHDRLVGAWFLEAGFGPCEPAFAPLFDTLDNAREWLQMRMDRGI